MSNFFKWFYDRKVFFILGLGRSGTKFLADLLNQDQMSIVFHEPIQDDFEALVTAHKSYIKAVDYIKNYRIKKMYSFVKDKDVLTYAEVNSLLRYHVLALKVLFPKAKILHLVRDGRDVVRSFMPRYHYTENATGHHSLQPKRGDLLFEKWHGLSRFEKICWQWADSNTRLINEVNRLIIFERLISDYSYFQKNIESYLGLNIGRDKWLKAILIPKNITKAHTMPPWHQWDRSLMLSFTKICGEVMQKLGYL